MQNEKVAIILLTIIIIGTLFTYIAAKEDIFSNLFKDTSKETLTIEFGDCVDLNYIGKFSDGTVFASSYNDTENKKDGTPLNIFVSINTSEYPPAGYEEYSNYINEYYVNGFIESLEGLNEGESITIGPLSPTDAYGVYPEIGDTFIISDPSSDQEIEFQFVDIIPNASMPDDYVDYYGSGNTTLFVLRYNIYTVDEKTTLYPSWENATVVTKINETKLWMYTTPPENRIQNFTWTSISSDGYSGIIFPENTSSITSINDTTIIVTHTPQKGDIITQLDYYYGYAYDFTIAEVTNDTLNVSYIDETTEDILYYEFDRTVTIQRNESQNITYTYPSEGMEEMLMYFRLYYDSDVEFSVNEYAGKYVTFEVQIEKIYKTG